MIMNPTGCKTCGAPLATNSKYCQEHKVAARQAWVQMVQEKSNKRRELKQAWEEMISVAHQKGMAAGEACIPVPMVVSGYEPILDGVCGFAYVRLTPGTSNLARWLVKEKGWHKSYHGGVELYVGHFNQSMTRKSEYARAFAQHLRSAGYEASHYDRLD